MMNLEDVLVAFDKHFKQCPDCKGAGGGGWENLGWEECGACGGDGHAYGDKVMVEDLLYTAGSRMGDFKLVLLDLWDLGKPLKEQHEMTRKFIHEVIGFDLTGSPVKP